MGKDLHRGTQIFRTEGIGAQIKKGLRLLRRSLLRLSKGKNCATLSPHTMPSHHKPAGQIPVPLFVFGAVALLLGVMTEILGVFDRATASLRALCESGNVVLSTTAGVPDLSGILVTTCASFGLAGAVLTTPGNGRRVILGVSALTLTIAFLPAFAVWGIFWKPFGMTLAISWSWFSSFLYARTHRMPCEGVRSDDAENVIPLNGERALEDRSLRADG